MFKKNYLNNHITVFKLSFIKINLRRNIPIILYHLPFKYLIASAYYSISLYNIIFPIIGIGYYINI